MRRAKLFPVRMQLVTELQAYLAEHDMQCLLLSFSTVAIQLSQYLQGAMVTERLTHCTLRLTHTHKKQHSAQKVPLVLEGGRGDKGP